MGGGRGARLLHYDNLQYLNIFFLKTMLVIHADITMISTASRISASTCLPTMLMIVSDAFRINTMSSITMMAIFLLLIIRSSIAIAIATMIAAIATMNSLLFILPLLF